MAARRYEISLRVLKLKYFASERNELVKYFSTQGAKFRISMQAAMQCPTNEMLNNLTFRCVTARFVTQQRGCYFHE